MNPFSLASKTVLVTGASSGIGRGVAIACAQMGAAVILNGRNRERLEETLSMMEGTNHTIMVADLSSQEKLESLSASVPELQGWVNSAGIPKISSIKHFDRENVEDIFNVNTISTMLLLSLLLKKKKLKRGASVIFISAVTGAFVGSKGDTSYCATKGAVNGFMKGAALELAPQGIRINSINPGLVPTNILNLANGIAGEEYHKEVMLEKYPLKRLGTPEDIANGAIYLLSDAASWITGINLVIDGGYLLN